MQKRIWSLFIVVALLVATGALSACVPVEAELGTVDNPVKLYFVPSTEVAVIVESGEAISAFLKERTGLEFDVLVPTTYAAVVEEMGASEGDAMAFIPAFGYVLAHDRYDMDVALAVVRNGWHVYWTEYVVRRDSPQSLRLDGGAGPSLDPRPRLSRPGALLCQQRHRAG